MTKRQRRRFSNEFKREAVRLVQESGRSLTQIARELGIRNGLLSTWRNEAEAKAEAKAKTGLTSDEFAELKQLRKDKARLEMEVRILGEATAFFANRNR